MTPELKTAIEEQGRAFEEFKRLHSQELAAIKASNQPDPTLREQIDRVSAKLADLDAVKARLDSMEAKANRPGLTVEPDGAKSAHAKAFDRYIRRGDEAGLAEKAVSVGTDADGGFALPEDLDRTIYQIERDSVVMRQIASVTTVANETYERLYNLGSAASGWVDETEARAETGTPSLASVKPTFGEIYANPAATQKSLDDLMFNVEAWLAEEVARQFAKEENAAFVSGNGTKKPKGILAYTFAETADDTRAFGTFEAVKSGAAAAFTPDSLLDVIAALNPGYEAGARWLFSRSTLFAIRKMKDGEDNYIWRPGMEAGAPATIWGFPYSLDANMPAAVADAKPILFGDFKRGYLVADVKGIRTLRDPFTAKPKVLFYTTKRTGGGAMDTNAIKALVIKL